jgi:Ca2+-binding EF-hand superfamily protein
LSAFLEILWIDRLREKDPVWEVATAFHNLDKNQSGYVNRTKLFNLLTGFGEKMEPIEVVNALERMRLAGYGLKIPITEIINHISG